MYAHTCKTVVDVYSNEYDEWEDFWCSLVITDEELDSVDLDDFELDLDDWLFLEADDPNEKEFPVCVIINFED